MLMVSSLGGQTLSLLNPGAVPAAVGRTNGAVLASTVMAALNDLAETLHTVFVTPPNLERWVNILIEEENAAKDAEYLAAVNLGRKPPMPKRTPPLKVVPLTPTVLKAVSAYVKLDQVLQVSYAVPQAGTVTVSFSLLNAAGAPVNTARVQFGLAELRNPERVMARLKEAVVGLYNLWGRYPYVPKPSAQVTVSLSPTTAVCVLPEAGLTLAHNAREILAAGTYRVVVLASNHAMKVTNLVVQDKPVTFRAALRRFTVRSNEVGKPPVGHLFLESDVPAARFLVMETGVAGQTPVMLTNLNVGEVNIVFDQTADYPLKRVRVRIRENMTVYERVRLLPEDRGVKVECPVEGAWVVWDRSVVGKVEAGRFSFMPEEGLHSLTVVKDFHEPFRTNIRVTRDRGVVVRADLRPKLPPGYVVTPQSAGVEVRVGDRKVGVTPGVLRLPPADAVALTFVANPVGYINLTTNAAWGWGRENTVVARLRPLYGDLVVKVANPGLSGVAVFVDHVYRGRTGSAEGLKVPQLLARPARVRLELEGYRTLSTNITVLPNVETVVELTMRESPVKGFVTTAPEKDFEVYVNGVYVGLSGAGALPFELGPSSLKLKKRGFKTIYTNLDLKTKDPVVLLFTSVPGEGEDEFLERIRAERTALEETVKGWEPAEGIAKWEEFKERLRTAEYAFLPEVGAEMAAVDRNIGALREEIQRREEEARRKAEEARRQEEERKFEAFLDGLVRDVDYGETLLGIGRSAEALQRFANVVKALEGSSRKDHPKARALLVRARDGLRRAEAEEAKKRTWWAKSRKAWTGLSFDLWGSDIAKSWRLADSAAANPMLGVQMSLHPLPVLGFGVGGCYNFGYGTLPRNEAFLDAALLIGPNLRIPVVPNWSFYGEYRLALDDIFRMADPLAKHLVAGGTELKWGAVGVRLFYQAGFTDRFRTDYQGVGAGVSLWLQGD